MSHDMTVDMSDEALVEFRRTSHTPLSDSLAQVTIGHETQT